MLMLYINFDLNVNVDVVLESYSLLACVVNNIANWTVRKQNLFFFVQNN